MRDAGAAEGWTVAASRLEAGTWTLRLEGPPQPPEIEFLHRQRPLGPVTLRREGGAWLVRIRLPRAILSDGLNSVQAAERASGAVLASLHVAAGAPVPEDMAAELALLRDELALLKRAFRRHLSG